MNEKSYTELEEMLRTMKVRSKLYEIVKKEMQRRKHWKNLPRGKAFDKKSIDLKHKL